MKKAREMKKKEISLKVYSKESDLGCELTIKTSRQNYNMMLIRGPT